MTAQTPPPTGDGTAAGPAPAPGTAPTGTVGIPGTAQIPPPTAAPASQKRATHTKGVWATLKSMFVGRLDAVPLATKIVACTVILLIVGTAGISLTLRQLVGNYMLEKTDTQLFRQAQLVLNNIDTMRQQNNAEKSSSSLLYSYFVQIRDSDDTILRNAIVPTLKDGVSSMPLLPMDGSRGGVQLQQPFTTNAVVTLSGRSVDHSTLSTAESPWRVVALPWTDEDGKPGGVCYIGLSLSDQLDTVKTLTRYCIIVGVAIVILTRIEQSFHEQEETTAKMKRFVSDASHELRTPLAAIHGYAELYKMQRDLPGALGRADESISHIEDSSTRMTVLVEDLLSLARLDEGRGIDITQQVPLTTLVTDATEDLHALDPGREIRRGTLTFQPRNGDEPADLEFVEGPLPDVTLKGDGSRLRQVVTNIVGNIHRYTPADSPVEISVGVMPASISPESLARMSANDASMRYFIEAVDVSRSMQMGMNYAVVRFSDHGPGVPENSRSKIFERFYTADPSRARLKGGTGLGMAIAQSVVKAHKGFICATDSQGGGLTLTVVLPVAPLEPKIAVGEPPQDAKAERKAERNKAKQEKQQARQHKSE